VRYFCSCAAPLCVIWVPVRYFFLCAVPLCVTWVSLQYFCSKVISLYSVYSKHLVFWAVNYSLGVCWRQFTFFGIGEMKQDGNKERNNRFYFYVFILH
jgi:hypothetical protein